VIAQIAGRNVSHTHIVAQLLQLELMPDGTIHSATIRSATEEDVPAVLALWKAARSPAGAEDTHESVMRLLANDDQALVIAVADGQVLGSLIAAWDGWRGSFYRLAVDPAHRRGGLASALLDHGERHLRARGALRLTAIVADDELAAMGFWRAAGYEQQSHRARFVRQLERGGGTGA
jgi:ribosomal protein S18 acetylase RimI-like enzyme